MRNKEIDKTLEKIAFIINSEKEKGLISIAFSEFEKNMPKSKEASALGMEKMYKAFVPAIKVVIHYYETEKRELLDNIYDD